MLDLWIANAVLGSGAKRGLRYVLALVEVQRSYCPKSMAMRA